MNSSGSANDIRDIVSRLRRRGVLFVISGPSGSGKNRVISEVLQRVSGLRYSISATTRALRAGEVDGRDYFFVTHQGFERMIADDELLEYAEVYGNYYGTPRKAVNECLSSGVDMILDIDIQGARKLRVRCPEAVFIFLLPPSIEELERRIRARGTEDEPTIKRRMDSALDEIRALSSYAYVVVNDCLEDAVSAVVSIIHAERLRTERLNLDDLVKTLSTGPKGSINAGGATRHE